MAGDQNDSFRVLRISPAQNRINIGDFGRLGNSIRRRLSESVGPYFEASAAIVRVAVEFAFDPLTCRADPVTRRNGNWILCGKRQPSPKAHQFLNGALNLLRRYFLQSGSYFGISGQLRLRELPLLCVEAKRNDGNSEKKGQHRANSETMHVLSKANAKTHKNRAFPPPDLLPPENQIITSYV